MVRNYKRKLIKLDEAILTKAIEEVTKGEKLQTIAKKYNIARGTLRGRMKKLTLNDPLHYKEVLLLKIFRSRFRLTHICLFNKIIFRDADFLPSEIINRFHNKSLSEAIDLTKDNST